MEDFNADNIIIDTELKNQRENLKELSNHSKDSQKHITQLEREKWNNLLWEMGTYIGDGNIKQNIDIGFKPRLGFIFQKDNFFITCDQSRTGISQEQRIAIITPLGCTKYCNLLDNGFSVISMKEGIKDYKYPMLNELSSTYVYIMFR